jgi:predicted ABC-type ATPase
VGDKIKFLEEAAHSGYTVLLCFIGLAGPEICEDRVAMRVSQGGHDVPSDKLKSRYPRTMANLKAAILQLPLVYVFDNSDLSRPFFRVAVFRQGELFYKSESVPAWFQAIIIRAR